ncbi:hypothetical protein C4B63_2g333 [Trypanosoma cruzi]|uniref:Uncharacterized protein n=1 Tax=Trypanosoma cruzi TaxID=5693 RepID=A0A2V2W3J5_TRYCR|nr:hypothetical protein C4B63_2g333 [Trypanosoma cruzi]
MKEGMPSVAEVESLIAVTRRSLAIPPRNVYEAENAYLANVERLKEARMKLGQFTGEYVERLLREMDKLEQDLNEMVIRKSNPVDALLDVEFDAEGMDNELDEVAAAEKEMEKKRDGRKKQGGRHTSNKKMQAKAGITNNREGLGGTSDLTPEGAVAQEEEKDTATVAETADVEVEVLAKYNECSSSEIPQEVLGPGRCLMVPNTPLVRLDFTSPVDYDGILCQCRVTLHRAVVTALTYGVSSTTASNCVAAEKSLEIVKADGDDEPPCNVSGAIRHEERQDAEDEVELEEMDEASVIAKLSKQLVAEYDAAQGGKEDEESGNNLLPLEVPPKLCDSLRSFTFLPWVILMCHGGYFAGGVFLDKNLWSTRHSSATWCARSREGSSPQMRKKAVVMVVWGLKFDGRKKLNGKRTSEIYC